MIGTKLAQFELTAKLGEGGMGAVYRAQDTKLGRDVAIKVLPEALTDNPERLARFEREARVLASLNHPNIAGIYQVEEVDGVHFLVMELVEGEDLAERLERGPLAVDRAIGIGLQLAEGLEVAHESGIVHRDFKPANVMVTPEGQVKILDFGLARAMDEPASESDPSVSMSPTLTAQMTQAGVILGTAAYMSPEQARGKPVDKRSDIWAFGIVLFEMLSGKRVFGGETVTDLIAAIVTRDPDWDQLPPDVPPAIRRLIERCLQREPMERLRDIGDARLAIARHLANPVADVEGAAAEPVAEPTWKRALPWSLAAALLLALATNLWLGPSSPRSTPDPRRVRITLADGERLQGYSGASSVISPDGSQIVYVDEIGSGGSFSTRLVVRPLDRWSGQLLVEGADSESPYHPFYSPDGRWVGFATRPALKKVPASGGIPVTLAEVRQSRGASWGPDNRIVFAPNPTSGLFVVSAAGGESEPLTTLDEEKGEVTHRWPQVLPDGSGVIFTSSVDTNDYETASIELLELGTGERRTLHEGGSYGRYVASGHLLFVRNGVLHAMPFDLDTLRANGPVIPVVEGVSYDSDRGGAQFDVSADGTMVYSTGLANVSQRRPVWVDREGNFTPFWEANDYGDISLSPDGTRMAVVITHHDNDDIWVYDLERQVPTRLTFADGSDSYPVWTPDGKQIYFNSERSGVVNMYRKAADGSGEVERVLESENQQFLSSISSDGKLLAYSQSPPGEEDWDIWLLPLEPGGEPRLLVGTPTIDVVPDFSPDGRWVVYLSIEIPEGSGAQPSFQIFVRPVSGAQGRWQVSTDGGIYPLWSADGRELFYRDFSGGVVGVEVETGAGGAFRMGRTARLFDTEFAVRFDGVNQYDVSTDGRRFVMLQEGEETPDENLEHIRLVFNWFTELERLFEEAGTN